MTDRLIKHGFILIFLALVTGFVKWRNGWQTESLFVDFASGALSAHLGLSAC